MNNSGMLLGDATSFGGVRGGLTFGSSGCVGSTFDVSVGIVGCVAGSSACGLACFIFGDTYGCIHRRDGVLFFHAHCSDAVVSLH